MKKLSLFLLLCISKVFCYAQSDFRGAKSYFNFKMTGYLLLHGKGAGGLSASFGGWKEMVAFKDFRIQPAFNLSANMLIGQHNLGNRNRFKNRMQFNLVASPLVTLGSGKRSIYEEIAPFYFGNSNSVYANYKFSGTIGSNFVLLPQGVRRNIGTFRNRTQQLIYIGLRIGLDPVKSVQLNIYEDFLGFTSTVQGLADNFDRFFTGGGNLQLRLHQNLKVKFYSEIYTGNFSRDLYDFPDLYLPGKYLGTKKNRKFLRRILTDQRSKPGKDNDYDMHPRYVAQEPGQKMFNNGRNFFEIQIGAFDNNIPAYYKEIDDNISIPKPVTGSVYFGWQGGHKQMRVQNYIHNFDTIDKINIKSDPDPIDELNVRKKKRIKYSFKFERLHHFYPSYERGSFFVGFGQSYSPQYTFK